jgi:mono/diheme cytochrome c family protein
MRYRTLSVIIGLAALAIWAAGLAAESDNTGADAAVAEVPEEAKGIKNPVRPTPKSLEDGQLIYSSQCAMCHGSAGDGRGELVERFGYEMPDFTDAEFQSQRTDGELFYVLTHGHGKMRGQGGRLDDKTRWNLVNYVRSFRPKSE